MVLDKVLYYIFELQSRLHGLFPTYMLQLDIQQVLLPDIELLVDHLVRKSDLFILHVIENHPIRHGIQAVEPLLFCLAHLLEGVHDENAYSLIDVNGVDEERHEYDKDWKVFKGDKVDLLVPEFVEDAT